MIIFPVAQKQLTKFQLKFPESHRFLHEFLQYEYAVFQPVYSQCENDPLPLQIFSPTKESYQRFECPWLNGHLLLSYSYNQLFW